MNDESRQEEAVRLGDLLRQARLKAGYDFDELSDLLRIRPSFLRAIERSSYAELPGPTYAYGFVRAYAEQLGLDTNDTLRRFRREQGVKETPAALNFPAPASEGGMPSGAVLLVGAVLALVGYGAWYYHSSADRALIQQITPVPERLSQLVPPGAQPPSSDTTANGHTEATGASKSVVARSAIDPQTAPAARTESQSTSEPAPLPTDHKAPEVVAAPESPVATTAPSVAVASSSSSFTSSSSSASSAAAAEPSEADHQDPANAGAGSSMDSRIVLRARADSWIEVRDERSNALVVARLLRSGDVYHVPDRAGLKLLTGNAGGLEVVVDGETMPPLGRDGMVRRGIVLDTDSLRKNATASN